jgi:hypothetical protein
MTARKHVRERPLFSAAKTQRLRDDAAWSAAPDLGDRASVRADRQKAAARVNGVRVRNQYRTPLHPSQVVCGTDAMYNRGCRCFECRDASRVRRAEQRRQKKAAESGT